MEELLDDPLAKSLYGLFLKVKDSPRHITIKPEIILNEVYLISNKIYQDAEPSNLIEDYEHEIDIAMKKLQAELSQYQNINPTNIYVTLNIQNDISGIDHLHLDHADVAVGVAEKGSNVYHHKKENHE